MESCIWCGKRPANSLEHIAPEALGCPRDFVLHTGVCARCNHRNGGLDRALLLPLEILTVFKGIPRKKGRPPTVDGFSSIASEYDENGPVFYMNREKFPVQIYFEGLDAARDPELDDVRRFVTAGGGSFRVIMTPDQSAQYDSWFSPCCRKPDNARVCGFTLLGIGFLCDFDTDFRGGIMLLDEIKRQSMNAQVIPNWPYALWKENNPPAL